MKVPELFEEEKSLLLVFIERLLAKGETIRLDLDHGFSTRNIPKHYAGKIVEIHGFYVYFHLAGSARIKQRWVKLPPNTDDLFELVKTDSGWLVRNLP
jgi:hypothetical protein